jgi:hypothetical protein
MMREHDKSKKHIVSCTNSGNTCSGLSLFAADGKVLYTSEARPPGYIDESMYGSWSGHESAGWYGVGKWHGLGGGCGGNAALRRCIGHV